MREGYSGRLIPGMDVCDIRGDKIGSLAHIYRPADALVGAASGGASAAEMTPAPPDAVLEVKTGLLGLGRRLYVPLSAVQDGLDDCLFLAHPRDDFERLGWYDKPASIDRLQ